jgi:hypothetical protein
MISFDASQLGARQMDGQPKESPAVRATGQPIGELSQGVQPRLFAAPCHPTPPHARRPGHDAAGNVRFGLISSALPPTTAVPG